MAQLSTAEGSEFVFSSFVFRRSEINVNRRGDYRSLVIPSYENHFYEYRFLSMLFYKDHVLRVLIPFLKSSAYLDDMGSGVSYRNLSVEVVSFGLKPNTVKTQVVVDLTGEESSDGVDWTPLNRREFIEFDGLFPEQRFYDTWGPTDPYVGWHMLPLEVDSPMYHPGSVGGLVGFYSSYPQLQYELSAFLVEWMEEHVKWKVGDVYEGDEVIAVLHEVGVIPGFSLAHSSFEVTITTTLSFGDLKEDVERTDTLFFPGNYYNGVFRMTPRTQTSIPAWVEEEPGDTSIVVPVPGGPAVAAPVPDDQAPSSPVDVPETLPEEMASEAPPDWFGSLASEVKSLPRNIKIVGGVLLLLVLLK